LLAAALVERRWLLIVESRRTLAAPSMHLIVVPRPLPAVPLAGRRRYLIVVPRPMPTAPRRYLIKMPRPMPTAPRRYSAVGLRP
jgi:hypothetical protein